MFIGIQFKAVAVLKVKIRSKSIWSVFNGTSSSILTRFSCQQNRQKELKLRPNYLITNALQHGGLCKDKDILKYCDK